MNKHQAVRCLFLEPQETYTLAEAAALLGWNVQQLAVEIASQHLITPDECATRPVAWRDVATLAATDWSYELIETALGSGASVLPPLVRLTELRVRLPRYQIKAIESAAQAAHATINAFLASHLLELASLEAPALRTCVPGFDEAFHWPATAHAFREARRLTSR